MSSNRQELDGIKKHTVGHTDGMRNNALHFHIVVIDMGCFILVCSGMVVFLFCFYCRERRTPSWLSRGQSAVVGPSAWQCSTATQYTDGKACKTGLRVDVKQNYVIEKHRTIRLIKNVSVVFVAMLRNWNASFTI